MPNLSTRKKQYYSIYDTLITQGYGQVSVWSFKKGEGVKYSSVTRDGYLGFGAGAGTHLNNAYLLNTFPVKSYIEKLDSREFPTALKFAMLPYMNNLFWLYWRFYDTRIPVSDFNSRFGKVGKIKRLLFLMRILGMLTKTENEYLLTRKGSFWLHLAQNYFSLQYINKIWSVCLTNNYPKEIKF